MKSFKDIREARGDTCVFTFGRFNPPTTGHEKLLDKVGDTTNIQSNVKNTITLNNYGNENLSHITDSLKTQDGHNSAQKPAN